MLIMNSKELSRRRFIRSAAGIAAATAAAPMLSRAAAESPKSETLVTTLYKSLNDEQRKVICMPFDHELRSKVDNNWHVTKPRLGKDFTADQQQMVKEIFKGLHSEEWADKVVGQVAHELHQVALEPSRRPIRPASCQDAQRCDGQEPQEAGQVARIAGMDRLGGRVGRRGLAAAKLHDPNPPVPERAFDLALQNWA